MLYHKGYFAYIQLNTKNDCFQGWVVNAHNLSFQGHNMDELKQAFIHTVDQYLQKVPNHQLDSKKGP